MINLPNWRLTSRFPAFLDSESGTAIEMTSKVYGAMQELINEYNAFATEMEQKINDFEFTTKEDIETFKTSMRQEFQDFIDVVELKLEGYEGVLEEVEGFVRTNITSILNEALASGSLEINALYNEETEELNFTFSGKVL